MDNELKQLDVSPILRGLSDPLLYEVTLKALLELDSRSLEIFAPKVLEWFDLLNPEDEDLIQMRITATPYVVLIAGKLNEQSKEDEILNALEGIRKEVSKMRSLFETSDKEEDRKPMLSPPSVVGNYFSKKEKGINGGVKYVEGEEFIVGSKME